LCQTRAQFIFIFVLPAAKCCFFHDESALEFGLSELEIAKRESLLVKRKEKVTGDKELMAQLFYF